IQLLPLFQLLSVFPPPPSPGSITARQVCLRPARWIRQVACEMGENCSLIHRIERAKYIMSAAESLVNKKLPARQFDGLTQPYVCERICCHYMKAFQSE